jgi:hypothetical protein
MNADEDALTCVHPRSSAVSTITVDLSFASIATRFALFAADLAAAPWLGHGQCSFHNRYRCPCVFS